MAPISSHDGEIIDVRRVATRKYTCSFCNSIIKKGHSYTFNRMKLNGGFVTYRRCEKCL